MPIDPPIARLARSRHRRVCEVYNSPCGGGEVWAIPTHHRRPVRAAPERYIIGGGGNSGVAAHDGEEIRATGGQPLGGAERDRRRHADGRIVAALLVAD